MHNNTKMKLMVSNFALVFLFNFSFSQSNPAYFKSEIDFGGGTVISTFLDVSVTKNQFTITSPKNADVRIMGGKARLGRLLGKSPKKGSIITIQGEQKTDSLFGKVNIPMFGRLTFKGIVKSDSSTLISTVLSGELLNTEGVSIGTISGVKSTENRINYTELYPKMMKTIQENIYSKSVLQTKEWKKFEKEIQNLCQNSHDDIELFFGFNILAQQLPFSHLSLTIAQDIAEEDETEELTSTKKSVVFEEKNNTTAYLLIKNFSTSTTELAATLPKIVANQNYKNLIVDLRNNPGGGVEAAFEFAKYITDSDMEVGYFLTNKLQYVGYQPELFKTLPELQPKGTTEFTDELKASPGVKLIFKKPNNPVFTGKIYILTNGNTASTCEPIVYILKSSKKATIIGEKTHGGMLSACPFAVSGKYMLILPIADFYTSDGVRLDRVGVSPDIEVKSEDALNKALEIINGGEN
jgi:hypothetical protein